MIGKHSFQFSFLISAAVSKSGSVSLLSLTIFNNSKYVTYATESNSLGGLLSNIGTLLMIVK